MFGFREKKTLVSKNHTTDLIMKKTLHWNTCARVIGRLKTIFLPSANSIETPINLTIVSIFRKILFANKNK